MSTFFTSDSHFGHDRIRTLCNRPYASIDDMNSDLVIKWNAVVAPTDTVWSLGDFCWKGYEYIFAQLNGSKHLIIGNHDSAATLALPWASPPQVYRELKVQHEEGVSTRVVLFHWPIDQWQGYHHGALHLHGHTHGNLADKPGRCDIGVDRWDMQPVTMTQIKARLASLI